MNDVYINDNPRWATNQRFVEYCWHIIYGPGRFHSDVIPQNKLLLLLTEPYEKSTIYIIYI